MPDIEWLLPHPDPESVRSLAACLGVQPLTASVLINRGLRIRSPLAAS